MTGNCAGAFDGRHLLIVPLLYMGKNLKKYGNKGMYNHDGLHRRCCIGGKCVAEVKYDKSRFIGMDIAPSLKLDLVEILKKMKNLKGIQHLFTLNKRMEN